MLPETAYKAAVKNTAIVETVAHCTIADPKGTVSSENRDNMKPVSVNRNVLPLLDTLQKNARELGLDIGRLDNRCRLFDGGITTKGSAEAGRLIAALCLGGLAEPKLEKNHRYAHCSQHVVLHTETPLLACLASQYAGWRLSHGEFQALASGPGRALGSKEMVFAELNYRDDADTACLILETDHIPPVALVDDIAQACQVPPERLSLVLTPTTSICGVVQIVSRVLETALHKLHTLKFPLQSVVSGGGRAPVCPVVCDPVVAMGCTNDAILLAGEVWMDMDALDTDLDTLAKTLPSNASADYGRPFAEIFKAANHNFYQIDPLLFAPASVRLRSIRTGRVFTGGRVNRQLLERSFAKATQVT